MMYYPKSQIKTSLTTQGGEFVILKTGKNYKGFYWKNSRGQFYTGQSPQDSPTEQLSVINKTDLVLGKDQYEVMPDSYYIEDINFPSSIRNSRRGDAPDNPIPFTPYNIKGNFTRYFASKTNEIIFIEISKNEYDKLKERNPKINWTLYKPIKIEWVVEGTREEVYLKNKTSVLQAGILGFEQYFRENYDKFWSS